MLRRCKCHSAHYTIRPELHPHSLVTMLASFLFLPARAMCMGCSPQAEQKAADCHPARTLLGDRLNGDRDFPFNLSLLQSVNGLGDLAQRIGAIDKRVHLASFGKLLQR